MIPQETPPKEVAIKSARSINWKARANFVAINIVNVSCLNVGARIFVLLGKIPSS